MLSHSNTAKFTAWLAVLVIFPLAALAESMPSSGLLPTAPASIDDSGTEETNVEMGVDTAYVNTSSMMEFMPQFSIFNATTLSVQTPQYAVDYGAVLEGLPIFHASLAVPIHSAGDFRFLVNTHLGVGTVRSVFPVKWKGEISAESSDRVRLVWMPVSVSTEVRYSVPGIPFFQPSLTVGAGGHLLMQRTAGRLPNADFWIPHVFVRPAMTFFDAATTAHWFGGFLFGVTWYHSVGDANRLRGTSFDLSLKFLL